ncbi:hypothetical protein KH990_05765 [Methanoculleus bourgensis]|jgi:hypothetical protein|uniref:Uncharacterized protein n=1 Tax=Methanoculleus bourgensis TaxID=83986 RepID=A0A0X3BLL9_9EURY|nr:hypothetical protein [Methanoculleus bourgensis]MBT0732874.1 hypothetical protein [Methanoculleus bourgensis]CVK33012.1 protein of unknown function [Methanoculleus bourgensis]
MFSAASLQAQSKRPAGAFIPMTVLLPSGNSTCHPDTDLAFDRTIAIFS